MVTRKRGVEVPSSMKRDIELYCVRTAQKEGIECFSIEAFTVRCGVSITTMNRVLNGTQLLSAAVIKRINQVLHNGGRFDGQPLRKVRPMLGKTCEIPAWLIPAIRTHLESKKTDKEAELEAGVVGGALRKICDGTRLSVREPTLKKMLTFYENYHTGFTGPSPRDAFTKKDVPKQQVEPVEKKSGDSVRKTDETCKLANRLIDAFNHLSADDRELLCKVAECVAKSSSVSAARAYATNLEKRLERQDGERATAESERDRREAGLLAEVNRQKTLLEQWQDTDVEGLKVEKERWKMRYETLSAQLEKSLKLSYATE